MIDETQLDFGFKIQSCQANFCIYKKTSFEFEIRLIIDNCHQLSCLVLYYNQAIVLNIHAIFIARRRSHARRGFHSIAKGSLFSTKLSLRY